MIHFELIFVEDVRQVTIHSFLTYGCPIVPVLFTEKANFPSLHCFCIFVKSQNPFMLFISQTVPGTLLDQLKWTKAVV